MILGVHHVQITIPTGAEAEARRFWRDIMGLQEIEKPDSLRARGGLWLQAGNQELHLGIEDGTTHSRAHGAWLVPDLDYWRERLQAAGVETETGIPIPGYDRFEFRDPFGNRVELIASTSPDVS
jgi:catechol 2,3-dioxygenase-like lactoylglutathione lyase family enzyme